MNTSQHHETQKPWKKLFSTTKLGGLAVLVVGIIAFNIIAAKAYLRLDVTQDRVFSLSPGSKSLLAKLGDEEIIVKLFFSRSLKELPVQVKTYATRVEEVLREYASHSKDKLRIDVVDPLPDTDDEELARKYGLQGLRLANGDEMFFGVVFVHGSQEFSIPYLDPRREQFLENDISMGLVNVRKSEKAKIGLMSGLPSMFGQPGAMGGGEGSEPWVVVNELKRLFEVETIPETAAAIDPKLKLLIVAHPKNVTDQTQYAIDQYLVGGGRLVVLVDPMSRSDLAASPRMDPMHGGGMPQVASDLPKLFAAWGVEYKPDKMVGDTAQQTQINAGGMALAYPYFIQLGAESLSKQSVITANLHQMMFAEAGEFSVKEGGAYTFEPLLTTSADSGTGSATMALYGGPQELARQLQTDGKKRVLAGLLRGKFKSAYTAAPAAAPSAEGQAPQAPPAYQAGGEVDSTVVLVGDLDFLFDQNALDKMQFANQVIVRPRNDNLNFLFNAVDVLSGSQDLIDIRSKGRIQRPFTRVMTLQQKAQAKWQKEEEQLSARLQELQGKLNELQNQRSDGSRFTLSAEQQKEVEKFRGEELGLRKRRREVRKNLREDIEALGQRLLFANMVVVPLAVSGFGVGVFLSRSRRRRSAAQAEARS